MREGKREGKEQVGIKKGLSGALVQVVLSASYKDGDKNDLLQGTGPSADPAHSSGMSPALHLSFTCSQTFLSQGQKIEVRVKRGVRDLILLLCSHLTSPGSRFPNS